MPKAVFKDYSSLWVTLESRLRDYTNLLPIPVLDGGKILLNLIEIIRRKPLKPETEGVVTMIGLGLMVLLMLAVTINDIMRYF